MELHELQANRKNLLKRAFGRFANFPQSSKKFISPYAQADRSNSFQILWQAIRTYVIRVAMRRVRGLMGSFWDRLWGRESPFVRKDDGLTPIQASPSRGDADDYWYGPYFAPSVTGLNVSAEAAMRLSAVFRCVKLLAASVGTLPLEVFRKLPVEGVIGSDVEDWLRRQTFAPKGDCGMRAEHSGGR